jgi:hypothetical protein
MAQRWFEAACWLAAGISSLSACGGGSSQPQAAGPTDTRALAADGGADQSRCDYKGRADREAVETAGPGAVQPNVRRVYQLVGTGENMHRVLVCREIDTNFDGVKDIVRVYNEKGESLREEADANYDGRIDTWLSFSAGRIAKEELDSDFDGNPDVWKYYVGGQLSRIQRDTNHDAKPDRWEFYANGKLERMGLDLDFDGDVDRWDHDELERLAQEAKESSQAAKTAPPVAPGAGPADAGAAPPAGADGGASAKSKRPKR